MPCTAAVATWSASSRALVGRVPVRMRVRASVVAPRFIESTGMPANASNRRAAAVVSP